MNLGNRRQISHRRDAESAEMDNLVQCIGGLAMEIPGTVHLIIEFAKNSVKI